MYIDNQIALFNLMNASLKFSGLHVEKKLINGCFIINYNYYNTFSEPSTFDLKSYFKDEKE